MSVVSSISAAGGRSGARSGGRYRIEERLGEGGMGVVYRAYDLVDERTVALKRLSPDSASNDKRRAMFEREYHTLLGLQHPRIIEVYDYGIDDEGPYYTMELLDGADLRGPLPFAQACQYLRDVACSLALLHARGLLHRDLSARNVRITSDGHAKLIDFGGLASFGRNDTIVGTPPCVAPEAIAGAPLDARTDLYGLGALAYRTLTRKHAYPAKTLSELHALWQNKPLPPSELAAEHAHLPPIPPALDELVMSLLSENPLARPASAVEVIVRLSQIAKLPPETEPLSPASYLRGGKTVGRQTEQRKLRAQLKAALEGRGSVALLEGEPGMGSTRLLSELAIEGRLLGAVSVMVDAGEHPGSYGVVEQIVQSLLRAEPDLSMRVLEPYASALARFLPTSSRRDSVQRLRSQAPFSNADPREQRLRTQSALQEWIEAIAREKPVVLAVRGVDRADDASQALLSSLALAAQGARLLIALSTEIASAGAPVSAPLSVLKQHAQAIRLRGLSLHEVASLLEGTFGEVDNIDRLAAWLHGLTGGNPQQCLDLVRHLVEQDVIAFREGAWVLPLDLDQRELPADFAEALRARVGRLPKEALRLARALATHHGPTPRARLLPIAQVQKVKDPFSALDALVQSGLVIASDSHVRFAHERARSAVSDTLSVLELRLLHVELGQILEREGSGDWSARLDAGYHLLHGGQDLRGADLLAEVGLELCYDGDNLPLAMPALRAALAVYRKHGRNKRVLARVLAPLAISGFYQDRETVETFGDEAADALSRVSGMHLALKLRPYLGRYLSLLVGLGVGVTGALFAHGVRAIANYIELLNLYSILAQVLTAVGSLTLDRERARRKLRLLEPLSVLGHNHAASISYDFARALALIPEDRLPEALQAARKVLARLDDPRPITQLAPGPARLMKTSALYMYGGLLAMAEEEEALAIAKRLEAEGWQLSVMFASQIRAAYHGLRGEIALCNDHCAEVERLAMLAGSSWQAELWATCSSVQWAMMARDSIALRRIATQLERLALAVPSLKRFAMLATAGALTLEGAEDAAHPIGEAAVADATPREFVGYAGAISGKVRTERARGNVEHALQVGLDTLACYEPSDLKHVGFFCTLIAEIALCESALGRHAEAARRIDDYLEMIGDRGGPAARGLLLETRAQVAIAAGDLVSARSFARRMQETFAPTRNPILIARGERLDREIEARDTEAHQPLEETTSPGLEPRRRKSSHSRERLG